MTRKVPTNLFPLTENFFIFFVVCSVSISHNGVKEEEEKKLLDMNCANIQETMRVNKKNLFRHCDKSRRLESIFLFF